MIEIENLSKSFRKGKPILKGLSAHFQKGKLTYVLGGSGSGKSVLLKHILGLLKPDSGKVLIDGCELYSLPLAELKKLRLKFGVLFQNSALFDDMDVYENIVFPLYEHFPHLSESQTRAEVHQVLEQVHLSPSVLLQHPNQLSGGMKKRVALARAIIGKPSLLLYDEPTTGLDPITRQIVDELIEKINRESQLTSLVVSHDLSAAILLADHIFFLNDGKVVFSGDPDAFLSSEVSEIQAFLKVERRLFQKKIFLSP